jgi:hypothetical protein
MARMTADRLTETQWEAIRAAVALGEAEWQALCEDGDGAVYFCRKAALLGRAWDRLAAARREGRI